MNVFGFLNSKLMPTKAKANKGAWETRIDFPARA